MQRYSIATGMRPLCPQAMMFDEERNTWVALGGKVAFRDGYAWSLMGAMPPQRSAGEERR